LRKVKHTKFDLVTAIRAFEKKSEFFKYDIQSEHNHFLRLPEQNKGKKRT